MRVSWSPAEGDDDDVITGSTLWPGTVGGGQSPGLEHQYTEYTLNTQHKEASVLSSNEPVGVDVPDVGQVNVASR